MLKVVKSDPPPQKNPWYSKSLYFKFELKNIFYFCFKEFEMKFPTEVEVAIFWGTIP